VTSGPGLDNAPGPPPRADIEVLLVANLGAATAAQLDAQLVLLDGRDPARREALIASKGERIRVIATDANDGASAALIGALPRLELISCFSAGLDNIDLAAAAVRGIRVTNTSAALEDDVADLAIAHCLMLLRRLPQAERYLRGGHWPSGPFPLTRSAKGRRLGVLGLGAIGMAVARRGEAMGMTIAYHARRPRPDVAYPYHHSLIALAADSDLLVVACPASPETRHIVNRQVLEALGAGGLLINIARGSVVDQVALITALETGVIAGAGLDVFEDEPQVAPALLAMDQVSLTPHVGSATHETREAMGQLMIDNIRAHFGAA